MKRDEILTRQTRHDDERAYLELDPRAARRRRSERARERGALLLEHARAELLAGEVGLDALVSVRRLRHALLREERLSLELVLERAVLEAELARLLLGLLEQLEQARVLLRAHLHRLVLPLGLRLHDAQPRELALALVERALLLLQLAVLADERLEHARDLGFHLLERAA